MYTIIETNESGKIFVQTVPDSWVKKNELYWPPDSKNDARKPSTLIKKNCLPELSWAKIKCRVLSSNIGKHCI